MFFGDFNASTYGGRINYAPAHANNPTTIADQAFAEFVEATKGTIIHPARSTWKNPFGGLHSKEAKLDFGIVYNFQEELAEAEVDWISPLHDHARASFTIGDTVWGNIQPPKPASAPQKIDTRSAGSSTQELFLVHVTRSYQDTIIRHGTVEGHQQRRSHRTVL